MAELAPALDVAILSRPEPTWRWQPLVREICPEAKIIYDTVDLHFLREARRAEIEADPAVARAAARYHGMELSLARIADATLVVSKTERDVLLDEDPDIQVHVVPNIHGEEHTGRPFEERKGVLFVGSFPHHPNRDAAHWLAEEIMPLVRLEDPDIPAYIVGSSPTDDIRALESESVRVLGWVPDLMNLLEHARISVAPLRYGAGVKGKVGESLAHGLPVVTTRLGAEGMGLEHEHDVLVADDAQAFANEILRAYHDADLWTRLAANGRRTIARDSSPLRDTHEPGEDPGGDRGQGPAVGREPLAGRERFARRVLELRPRAGRPPRSATARGRRPAPSPSQPCRVGSYEFPPRSTSLQTADVSSAGPSITGGRPRTASTKRTAHIGSMVSYRGMTTARTFQTVKSARAPGRNFAGGAYSGVPSCQQVVKAASVSPAWPLATLASPAGIR